MYHNQEDDTIIRIQRKQQHTQRITAKKHQHNANSKHENNDVQKDSEQVKQQRKKRPLYKFYRIKLWDDQGQRTSPLSDEAYNTPAGQIAARHLAKYCFNPDLRQYSTSFLSASANLLIQQLDALPLADRPFAVEIETPTGLTIRRWSRVNTWNYPVPYQAPAPFTEEEQQQHAFSPLAIMSYLHFRRQLGTR